MGRRFAQERAAVRSFLCSEGSEGSEGSEAGSRVTRRT